MENAVETVRNLIENPQSSSQNFRDALENLIQYYTEESQEREYHYEFLTTIFTNERRDLLVTFVEVLQETNPQELVFPTTSYLLTLGLSPECIVFLASEIEYLYFEMLEGLFSVTDDVQLASALLAVDEIFGEDIGERDVKALIDHLKDYEENEILEAYLLEKLQIVQTDVAPIPEWIIPGELIVHHKKVVSHETLLSTLPQLTKSTYVSKNPKADVDYVIGNNYISALPTAENSQLLKQEFIKAINPKSAQQRTQIVRWTEDNTRNMLQDLDAELFSVLGPCLMMPGAIDLDNDSKDVCRRYGGCRMFTCYENENIDPDTGDTRVLNIVKNQLYDKVEWYTGICGNPECTKKILAKHYAVRMPRADGGWKGCYCSWECINAMIPNNDMVGIKLTAKFQELVENVGIYDRTWD